jgi:hypothetical protein
MVTSLHERRVVMFENQGSERRVVSIGLALLRTYPVVQGFMPDGRRAIS